MTRADGQWMGEERGWRGCAVLEQRGRQSSHSSGCAITECTGCGCVPTVRYCYEQLNAQDFASLTTTTVNKTWGNRWPSSDRHNWSRIGPNRLYRNLDQSLNPCLQCHQWSGKMVFELFGSVRRLIKLDQVCIDNNVFRLHYKATVIFLVAFSLLVTSNQYFGDPIDCIQRYDDSNTVPTLIHLNGSRLQRWYPNQFIRHLLLVSPSNFLCCPLSDIDLI